MNAEAATVARNAAKSIARQAKEAGECNVLEYAHPVKLVVYITSSCHTDAHPAP
jgi:hypothetical protein